MGNDWPPAGFPIPAALPTEPARAPRNRGPAAGGDAGTRIERASRLAGAETSGEHNTGGRMRVTSANGMWFEPTPRRLLDSSTPVSRLMTAATGGAPHEVRWPHLPSVSARATVREAAHVMATCGVHQVQVRDARGEVVGVLAASALFRWVAGSPDNDVQGGIPKVHDA